MQVNIWQGEKIRLRAMEPGDWEAFQRADEDTEVARACYFIPFPRSAEGARKWALEQSLAEAQQDAYRWVIENCQGEVVGTINTHDCNRRNGTFRYGLAIRREYWRRGYASEAIRLVLAYFFLELRYQKATVEVYSFNQASIALHEKLGFQHEGRLRRMIYTNGAYHDIVMLGLTVEEFKQRYGTTGEDEYLRL